MKLPLIHPENGLKVVWDFYVILLTLLSAIVIPLQISVGIPFHNEFHAFEGILSISFGIDLILHFFTSIHTERRVISNHREIAKSYLRSWFFIDLIAALPLTILFSDISADATFVIRLLRLLQIHRMLKLARISSFFTDIQRKYAMNPGLFRLGYFVVVFGIVTHILACGWIILGGVTGEDSPLAIYITALYYTITTLASVGYGDIVPQNHIQKGYAILLMLFGVGSYGYVIGNLASFLANRDIVRSNYYKKLEEVNAFLRYRAIPNELRQKVMSYYGHLWESRMGQDEGAMLNDLPESLKIEIALVMRRDLIQKVPFFREAQDDLLKDLVLAVRPVVFIPGALIMQKGDIAETMYIISSGTVEILNDDGTMNTTLGEGSFLGEMALVFQRERNATARARDYCDLYVLQKRHFDSFLQKHPAFAHHVRMIAEERRQT